MGGDAIPTRLAPKVTSATPIGRFNDLWRWPARSAVRKGLSARSVLTWIRGGPEATQHGSEACRQAPILSRSVRPIGAPRDGCERSFRLEAFR
jgi:hypothetical protein